MDRWRAAWQRLHEFLEGPGWSRRVLWYAYKLAWGVAMVGIVSICYFNASRLTGHRSTDLATALDRAIPFVPWSWWFYFPGYLALLIFSICALRDLRVYYRSLWSIFLAQSLSTVIFFLLPSTYPRPSEAGGGFTGDAIRWFWDLDPPNNTFPSKHVAISLLAAFGTWMDPRTPLLARLISSALALGVVITVHTTKQHYLVDTLAGTAVATLSAWLVYRWWPRRNLMPNIGLAAGALQAQEVESRDRR